MKEAKNAYQAGEAMGVPPAEPKPRYPDVEVELVGHDGNAFAIMGRVADALREAGYGDQVDAYRKESMSGDYDHLLRTASEWVSVS